MNIKKYFQNNAILAETKPHNLPRNFDLEFLDMGPITGVVCPAAFFHPIWKLVYCKKNRLESGATYDESGGGYMGLRGRLFRATSVGLGGWG
jgi:hypothetical protein